MMKPAVLFSTLTALLLESAALKAAESCNLETQFFVFRNAEVRSISLPETAQKAGPETVVFQSPAKAHFDETVLSLDGAEFSWGESKSPPDRLSPIETPSVVLPVGRPVSLLSAVAVQYLEKDAEGNLEVREIPKNSPDAPHSRFTFSVSEDVAPNERLRVVCDVDLASVKARENLDGVALPVGKPVLARFSQVFEMSVRGSEWSAFLVQSPGGGDHSLLTLLRILPVRSAEEPTGSDRLMSGEEFAVFATYYYQNPQPELVSRAIASLGSNKLLENNDRPISRQFLQRADTCVGFFAAVFAANPERVQVWQSQISKSGLGGQTRGLLLRALQLTQPGAILAIGQDVRRSQNPSDVFWGAFMASGDPVYVRKIVDRFELVDSSNRWSYQMGADSILLLAFHAPHHPLVKETLGAVRSDVGPRVRGLIDDVLTKEYASLRRDVRALATFYSDSPMPEPQHYPWGVPLPDPPKFP